MQDHLKNLFFSNAGYRATLKFRKETISANFIRNLIKIESKHSKINQPPNLFISIRCTCTNLSTMSSIFLRNCSGVFTRSESTLVCFQ